MACPCAEDKVNSFCAMLPPEERKRLCAHARVIDYAARERVDLSTICDDVAILREGVVASNVVLSDSGESSCSFLGVPGDVFNVMRVAGDTQEFCEGFNDADYGYVIEPARCCLVPLAQMRAMVADGAAAQAVIVQLTNCYKRALSRMYQNNYDKAENRVRWLIESLDRMGIDAMRLTHEEMARILGMNRVTVTKALQKMF